MKTNEQLQTDVQNAIKWEPLLNTANIGVTAIDGVITLMGKVDSYARKLEAEKVAKNIAGVKAVAENIDIIYDNISQKTDTEIALEVVNAWKWNREILEDNIMVKVEAGFVTLTGELQWNYQKEAAEKSIGNLMGIVGIVNNITIKPLTNEMVEKADIEGALSRSWSIDSGAEIDVEVKGNTVTLTGVVDSLYQKDEAARIAWNAPGVSSVFNQILVELD